MEEQQRQFRGVWIPREVWVDSKITPLEKMFLVEIDSLEDEEKGCWASNKHFENIFGTTSGNSSRILKNLKDKGYIKILYDRKGKEIICRHIYINRPPYPNNLGTINVIGGVLSKCEEGYYKNVKERNTYISNTNNIYVEIINFFNNPDNLEKNITNFKSGTKAYQKLINGRLEEGYTLLDFKKVIYCKYKAWKEHPFKFSNGAMSDAYYKPDTLFKPTTFGGYLQEYENEVNRRNGN